MFSLFKFQRSRWFWGIRYFLNRVSFFTGRYFFQLKDKIEQIKESSSISKELFKAVIPSLIFAFFTIILLILSEKLLLSITIQKPVFIKGFIDLLRSLNLQLMELSTPLETLLSVTASVSGVFLGLYFTAISVIASSVYAKVPSDIRALLLKEKVGNFYIEVLIVLTSICLVLLGYNSVGGNPGVLNLIAVTLLGCFGIISFGILGIRAFFFFDPTRLSDTIFSDLLENVRSATINGFRWSDPSFQSHYHKQALKNISTLDTLIAISSQERYLKSESLSPILQKLVFFLKEYGNQRSHIPSHSRWYTYVPRYKDWFLTDSSALEMAVQSRVQIQPDMIPDHFWLEDKAIEILIAGSEEVIKGDFEKAYEVINVINTYLENLGANLELRKGKEVIKEITNLIDNYFEDWKFEISKRTNNDLALYEMYLLMPISLVLGFNKFLREAKSQDLISKIDSIDWNNSKEIYKGFPPLLLERLEFIQSRLYFEWKVESNFISPNWYIRQLIAIRYLELLKEAVDETLLLLDKFFVLRSEYLLSQKKFVLVAFHSHRALELINKVEAHQPHLKKLIEGLNITKNEKNLKWVNWDWQAIDNKLSQTKDKLMMSLAKCLPALSPIDSGEDFPDLFGQTYSFICEDCYESMQVKNKVTFKNLFPLLFMASFSAYEKLRTKATDLLQQYAIAIVLEPLIDIMELSGYAKIYSELYDNPGIWDECVRVWNIHFDENKDSKNAVQHLIDLYKYKKKLFGLTPRDIIRTKWKIGLLNTLSEMQLIYDPFSSGIPWKEDVTVKHKSPFIRALCRGRYEPHISGTEVFIISYLLKRPESKDVEFKDLHGLDRAMKREENNNKEALNV